MNVHTRINFPDDNDLVLFFMSYRPVIGIQKNHRPQGRHIYDFFIIIAANGVAFQLFFSLQGRSSLILGGHGAIPARPLTGIRALRGIPAILAVKCDLDIR